MHYPALMLNDSGEALWQGFFGTGLRLLLAGLAFGVAIACQVIASFDPAALNPGAIVFLLVTVQVVWLTKGAGAIAALFCLILFVYLAWLFIDTSSPTLVFYLLTTVAFLFLTPVSWIREVSWWRGLLVFAGFSALYWGTAWAWTWRQARDS